MYEKQKRKHFGKLAHTHTLLTWRWWVGVGGWGLCLAVGPADRPIKGSSVFVC